MNTAVVAVTVMAIEKMSNEVIAAANNGITGFGKVHPVNIAYETMREANLINIDGSPIDKEELERALSFEILRRFW